MSFRSDVVVWMAIVAALIMFLLGLMVGTGQAANVTIGAAPVEGHIIDQEPEHFYLFNGTTRKYEDIIQFEVEKSKGFIWVKMRAANLTVVKYLFTDKEWARVYVDDTLTVVSAINMTVSTSTKVKFSLDKWALQDDGESITVYQVLKTNDESINETWTFYYKLGKPPKITWYIEDLDDKAQENRTLDWKVKIQSSYFSLKTKAKANATTTKFKVKDLSIDWVDFGTSNVQVASNATSKEYTITFYPGGKGGNYTVDPSVSFTSSQMTDVCWVELALTNPQNPTNPSEVTRHDDLTFVWYDAAAPGNEIPVDSNPFPVPNSISAYVKVYDNWGRSWATVSFLTGVAGTYSRVEGDLPLCWISVRCWNGIRNDGFHRWAIRESGGGGTWAYVDNPVKHPVIVDDANQVNWEVWVPEDSWIKDAGTATVTHANMAGRDEYVVNFDVTLKSEPTTVYIRLYDSATGEGIPWERFIVKWDSTITPTNVIQAWTDETHTVEVVDFWGNELYIGTRDDTEFEAPIYLWKIPITVHSVKMFNQEPNYIHKVRVYYNLVDGPLEFYIAPLEVIELHLKAADYRIKWTPYRSYVAQDTQQFDLTVSAANYFLINGTTISRVVSDVAGVYALQQVITRFVGPDVLFYLEDMPRCPVGIDSEMGVQYVHPYAITRATVTYAVSNSTTGLLWLPHPDRPGRTYDILSDRITIAGPYLTRLIVNWSGNGTEASNTSYNPGVLELADGEAYTFWANRSVTVTRTVEWREFDLFYWAYYNATSKYLVTRWVNNTQNVTWRDVRFFVGFPEDSEVDIDGVMVEDVDNDVVLSRGENFDVTVGGIAMSFTLINASQVRAFRLTAWDLNATLSLSPPMIMALGQAREHYKNDLMHMAHGSWTNDYGQPYHGTAFIRVDIDDMVDPDNVVVYDVVNERELSEVLYSVAGNTIIVSSEAVGTVPIGGALEYKVYYDKQPGGAESGIFAPLIVLGGFGLSIYWLAFGFLEAGVYVGRRRVGGDFVAAMVIVFAVFAFIGLLHMEGAI